MIRLEAEGWRLDMLPEIGGAIGRLAFQGVDVLRPATPDTYDPFETACFPLVPFANRVANGSFSFEGQEVQLPVLDRFHPHAIHGEAWLQPWSVIAVSDRSIALQFSGGRAWPWPYRSTQTITLGPGKVVVALAIANTGVSMMPAGLGLHPYFLAGPDARLTFHAEGVWLGEAGGIPETLGSPAELFDFANGPTRRDIPFIDHCYAGWLGAASIEHGAHKGAISVTSNASWAHVYSPNGQGYWCFEPMTHRPDALNAPAGEKSGLRILRPGETMEMRTAIVIQA